MSARVAAASIAAILLVACAMDPSAPAATGGSGTLVELKNPGFQEPIRPGENCAIGWGCTMHNDPHSFRFFHVEGIGPSGGRAYCIEAVGREPWGRLDQAIGKERVVPIRGSKLRFSVSVKTDGMTAGQAGPALKAYSGSGRILQNVMNLQPRKDGWQRLQVEATLPPDTFLLDIGVVFEGKGRVCVDDARLEMTEPPRGPV